MYRDDLYRLIVVTGTVGYSCDLASNRTHLTYPTGEVVTYTHDADGRLVQVEDWDGGLTTYGYDVAGRLITTTLPNGVVTVNEYDDDNRLVNLTHTAADDTLLSSYNYELDGVGNRVRVTETLTGTTRVITNTYDSLDRLTSADYSTGESFKYTYDAIGNRRMVTNTTPLSGTVVTTYTFDAANCLTNQVRSDGRAYTYTWSARGQMLAEWTQGVPVRTFSYDGAGRMITATVFTLTTHFTYNGLGARVAVEVVGHGTTMYTLDYARGNRVLAEATSGSTVHYLYGHDCLGELRDDEWLYYLNDATGYVRQGADTRGQVVSGWLFDPDGTVLEGPEGPVSHLICGGVYDWSTGLIHKDGRYFDPMLGLWLALLPLVVVQSWRGRKKRRGFPWYSLLLVMCIGGMLTACQQPPPPLPPTPPPGDTPEVTECVPELPLPTPDPCQAAIPGPGCPTPTPTPCAQGTSYAACFESVPGYTGIMEFADGEEIDEEKLVELTVAIQQRLDNRWPPPQPGDNDPGRGVFDTPFYNAGGHRFTDTELRYQGNTYLRSEVNYVGQGMWGAIAGETLEETLNVVRVWKEDYGHPPSQGTIFWTTYGYNAYKR